MMSQSRLHNVVQARAIRASVASRVDGLLPALARFSFIVACASLVGLGYAAALAWSWVSDLR